MKIGGKKQKKQKRNADADACVIYLNIAIHPKVAERR